MKKLYILLCLLVMAGGVKASHFIGADLRYEYTGAGNVYKVYLNTYEECQLAQVAWGLAEAINFQSPTLGVNIYRYFVPSPIPSATEDTIRAMWCSSISPGCQTSNPYFLVHHFVDTITLPTAPDWRIGWEDGSRNNSIVNLQNPSGYDIYLDAFLNNSQEQNSSPVIAGSPFFINPVNAIVSNSFQVTDVEGDSLVESFIQPRTTYGTVIPYVTGYSISQPFGPGSFAQLDQSNSLLKSYSSNTGRFALATRISEYRNGTLVGSSCRDWAQSVISVLNPKAPLPAAGSKFTYTTCPGQPNSYTYTFVDSVVTDSVYLKLTPPNNGVNYTVTSTPGIGSATATISWTTPTSWTAATNPYFFIKAYAYDNHCPLRGYSAYNILVKTVNNCNSDTVWAGDANADHYVNMYDPLSVAVAYGAHGPARSNASLAWTAQWCADWAGSAGTGVNYKHADCDGNGTVNVADLNAIYANYGLVHLKPHQQYSKGAGLPDVFFTHDPAYVFAGGWIYAPLYVGTSSGYLSNVYGIAARVRLEGVTPDTLNMSYWGTWLGTPANTLLFRKDLSSNAFDWAYARINHSGVTDNGEVAALSFTIPASTPYGTRIVLSLEDVRIIDGSGNEITGYNVLNDTMVVNPLRVGSLPSVVNNAVIVPNPSGERAVLRYGLGQATNVEVLVTDMVGHLVWRNGASDVNIGQQEVALPEGLSKGLYMIRLKAGAEQFVLKWVRD